MHIYSRMPPFSWVNKYDLKIISDTCLPFEAGHKEMTQYASQCQRGQSTSNIQEETSRT